MRIISPFLKIFVLSALLLAGAFAEPAPFGRNTHGLVHSQEGEEKEAAPGPAVPPFKGFGRYREASAFFCSSLDLDGRRRGMYGIVASLASAADSNSACVACRPLYRQLSQVCKGSRKNKGDAKKMKRLPHAVVVDRAVAFAYLLAEDTSISAETAVAWAGLMEALRSPAGKSAGEAEYFGTLSEYLEKPFSVHLKGKGRVRGAGGKHREPDVSLDDLF